MKPNIIKRFEGYESKHFRLCPYSKIINKALPYSIVEDGDCVPNGIVISKEALAASEGVQLRRNLFIVFVVSYCTVVGFLY